MTYNYSVIVPYRDKYDLFVKAVNSIPDREDIQIIVVDNSLQPLNQETVPVKQQAKVISTISSLTKGAGCARNEGLKLVKGRFLLFLDADDYYTPEAFPAFDNYLESDFDIVYFKPTSIRLSDGMSSDRHNHFVADLESYFATGDERRLRYRWEVPWGKLFRTEFVLTGGFHFEEIKVSNDTWFSLMTGHNARKIAADKTEVYVVTEGSEGQSLIKTQNRENAFIRYGVAIRVNKFLKAIGRYDMRIRLLGAIRIAFTYFGICETFRYLKYAFYNRVGIF